MHAHSPPLRRVVIRMIFICCGTVLAVTASALFAYEALAFRQSSIEQLETLGEAIASNSTAALAFDIPEDATTVLAAFRADPHIKVAALYDAAGEVFATYPADLDRQLLPAGAGQPDYAFSGLRLSGFQPVTEGERQLGMLYLESDLGALFQRLQRYAAIMLAVALLSLLVAWVVSRRLQRRMLQPIMALADTARAVSDRRDYAVRAALTGMREFDMLADAFNHMLQQIQDSEANLQRAYDDLRQSQLTMLQQERLRALGQMASGIAHDINNAISPVSLYTESLLEREPALSERARTYLTTIQQAIDDVARTVARMREFYRERETLPTLQPVDLNRAVAQVVDLTRPRWSDLPQQLGASIELRTELAAELPTVMGADNEIRDALTNLVFNAVDAMPSGGTLALRTHVREGAQGHASVIVEVSDTGAGMDEETRRKCLEPFFTTKGERGTGLGLAMVYGMAQRHSAGMEIDSALGQGTTVRLVFAAAAPDTQDTPSAPPSRPGRPLRLLLVDDDPMLIRSLLDILQEDGHQVTPCNGGEAGIDAFLAARAARAPFDLVITDLGMPHTDGRRVAAAVKAASPTTPVVLLTGWGQRLIATRDTPPHVDKVLAKPPRLQDLRAAFAELAP